MKDLVFNQPRCCCRYGSKLSSGEWMTPFQMEILPLDLVYVWLSVCGDTGQTNLQEDRWDDTIHLTLIKAWAGRVKWTRVVNESYSSECICVCPLIVLRQVSDLVLIDPIPEDVFEEDQWKEYWWVYRRIQGHRKDGGGEKGREAGAEDESKDEKLERCLRNRN